MPDAPRVFVVVPVHNRIETTMRFAACLIAQSWVDWRLILVDDGSTDGTAEAVASLLAGRVEVVRGDGSWWWAGSLQHGLQRVAGLASADDVVLLCNDDVAIGPEFISGGVEELTPGTLLLARCRSQQSGALIDLGIRFDPRHLRFRVCAEGEAPDVLSTRGLFARWGDLRQVGGFVPEVLPHYLSDYEFTLRAKRRGLGLRVTERAEVVVDERTTGIHDLHGLRGAALRRTLFSNRYASNPRHRAAFARLACPFPWGLIHAARIWLSATLMILRRW